MRTNDHAMKQLCVLLFVAAVCLPVWASEPGEPLDCSDFVAVDPSLKCEPSLMPHNQLGGTRSFVDNEGRVIHWDVEILGECGTR